jgi:tetratricopeptide (TPR) repeat protein
MPPLEKVALPEEQPQMAAMVQALAGINEQDPKAALPILDRALAALPKPTLLRGVLQVYRATALDGMNRTGEAIAAIDEAVRLLPDYSGPLMVASNIHLYSNNAGLAADDLLRASEIDPDAVRLVDDYEVSSLMLRLDSVRDGKRVQRLGDRLLDLGWTGAGVRSRSQLAKAAIQRAVADGDLPRARKLIPSLLDPEASYEFLSINIYKPIWADLEKWGGPRLETQWRMYLDEARHRWEAGNDLERGSDYTAALSAAGALDRLIAGFLPLFDTPRDAENDWPMLFMASKLSAALMSKGRVADAVALYDRAEKTWPLGSSANALNIAANRASALLNSDRPAEALNQIDLAVEDSRRWPGQINADAIVGMHFVRACALHALGRDNEAAVSASIAAPAGHAQLEASIALCMGDPAAARAALIKGFGHPGERASLIMYMQPDGQKAPPTVYGRAQREAIDALRRDPQVLAALAPYGRIMSYARDAAAPK